MTTIALAGNPNSGKTTLFNALTGSRQFVGNWPGVTVEKKEGQLKGSRDVTVTDLPGIYSLSPYTLEEVVARSYILGIDTVSGKLLPPEERPDVILNIIDGTNLERNLYLTTQFLELGIPVVAAVNMLDVLQKTGDTIDLAKLSKGLGCHCISISALKGTNAISAAETAISIAQSEDGHEAPVKFGQTVECAISDIAHLLPANIPQSERRFTAVKLFERDELVRKRYSSIDCEAIIAEVETKLDNDSESIIASGRYDYIEKLVKACFKRKPRGASVSEKIDRVVMHRIFAIPIFFAIIFIVYYISITTIGAFVTDWTNDVLFGEIIPPAVEHLLDSAGALEWQSGLILDGIIAGVGAVLGFVPQMLILFLFLAFLEACGYMARIAFIMDRVFRRFGLSGKSFIPFLIGTGCGVPGIMASRTIETESDRRMTIITTTFMPCGAKLPFIALIAGAMFDNNGAIAFLAYLIGIASILVSGSILKNLKRFKGEVSPFVMELPNYHLPTALNLFRSMWERGWSFIKRAGSIILLSAVAVWFLSNFGFIDGKFQMVDNLQYGLLATIGNLLSWIFIPAGFGDWRATVAVITGLIAKENIVATIEILYQGDMAVGFTQVTAFAFLLFNLLCAPCVAAMGAIRREMNSGKWTAFAICYQCGFAYVVAVLVNLIGTAFVR
ncbi:MAG: ferrous iron transport protein B [Oscillospiraceae bacterium]|jgi:ferrous iron transport protein B|nr:ferrous iron transport protein B [Oscillospiraceae bacterium]